MQPRPSAWFAVVLAIGVAACGKKGGDQAPVEGSPFPDETVIEFKTQETDGTWWVKSRSNPFQPYYEGGFPHFKNQFISSSSYSGRNLLSSAAVNANVISNIDGTTIAIRGNSQVTAAATNLAGQSISNTATALVALTQLNAARATIATTLGNLGADTRTIVFQDEFITKLTDAQEVGLGSIVDADLAKESARLQALQVQQQLSIQTLNIANQRPNVLLSLFR